MSKVRCKSCGAVFDAGLSYCPYCGVMNKRGAYAEFRGKISSLTDAMFGLKEDVQQSVSRMILSSLLRSLLFIAVIVGAAYAFSRTAQVNYYNDPEYDQKAYEEIVWMDENLDRLNEAYESGNYKAVEKLYYENTRAVQKWSRYAAYKLKYAYQKIEAEDRFDLWRFRDMLYFLFYPEYYTGYNGMKRVDETEYNELRQTLVSELEDLGYTYTELEEIYAGCSDDYGYMDADLLKKHVKEDGNG